MLLRTELSSPGAPLPESLAGDATGVAALEPASSFNAPKSVPLAADCSDGAAAPGVAVNGGSDCVVPKVLVGALSPVSVVLSGSNASALLGIWALAVAVLAGAAGGGTVSPAETGGAAGGAAAAFSALAKSLPTPRISW